MIVFTICNTENLLNEEPLHSFHKKSVYNSYRPLASSFINSFIASQQNNELGVSNISSIVIGLYGWCAEDERTSWPRSLSAKRAQAYFVVAVNYSVGFAASLCSSSFYLSNTAHYVIMSGGGGFVYVISDAGRPAWTGLPARIDLINSPLMERSIVPSNLTRDMIRGSDHYLWFLDMYRFSRQEKSLGISQ